MTHLVVFDLMRLIIDGTAGTKDIKPVLSTPGSEGDDGDGRAGGAIDSGAPSNGQQGFKGQKTAGGAQQVVHVKETPDSAVTGAAADGAHIFRPFEFDFRKLTFFTSK